MSATSFFEDLILCTNINGIPSRSLVALLLSTISGHRSPIRLGRETPRRNNILENMSDEEKGNGNGATFIPDQLDPLDLAVTEAVRHGPFTLGFRDLITAIRMFTLFPGVILPLWTSNPQDEFYLGLHNSVGLILLCVASVSEAILLVCCVPMFLLLPGPVSIILFICGQIFIHLVCWPMQGPSKVWSKTPTNPEVVAKYERVKGERWFFLNGCM